MPLFDPNNMHQNLHDFLVKNKALTAFLINIIEANSVLNHHTDIDNAFIWHKTKEGEIYWVFLDNKYEELQGLTP